MHRAGLLGAWLIVGCAASPAPPPTPPRATPSPESEPPDPEPPVAQAMEQPAPSTPRPPNTVFRTEIDRALRGGPGYLLAQLGPEPFRLRGHFVGWEITRLFPDDPELAATCDLRVGDVVVSVNGDPLATPQAFTAMLEALPQLDSLEVVTLRDEARRVTRYALASP